MADSGPSEIPNLVEIVSLETCLKDDDLMTLFDEFGRNDDTGRTAADDADICVKPRSIERRCID